MTEDELINILEDCSYASPQLVPKEFKNKEFVLKLINQHNMLLLDTDLDFLGVDIDYDIALAMTLRQIRVYEHISDIIWIRFESLDPKDITKLKTTLQLLN